MAEKTDRQKLQKIQAERTKKRKPSFFSLVTMKGQDAHEFVTSDMWRLYDFEVTGVRGFFVRVLQVIYIAAMEYTGRAVGQKANSLTYSTLLSLVPLLVVLLSVAAGFGLQESVQRQLYEYFPAQQHELTQAFKFADSYLNQIQSSVFIGVGVVILLIAVISLLMNVENVFNNIWHIKKPRPISKRVLGYFATFLIVPLVLAITAGFNVFSSFLSDLQLAGGFAITPILEMATTVVPFFVWIALFTLLYKLLPNTRVHFVPALVSGILAGVAFQFFQLLYISGQIWVTKYNSIYGSFAAIPLLMLFTNWSWVICLFGAQVSYAIQNIRNYTFKTESEQVSRRFRDFVAIVLMKKICKAFVHDNEVYTAEALADHCDLPMTVVSDTLDKLYLCKLLSYRPNKKDHNEPYYTPALDISVITPKRIVTLLDRLGSENFRIDIYDQYAREWALVRNSRPGNIPDMDVPVVDL